MSTEKPNKRITMDMVTKLHASQKEATQLNMLKYDKLIKINVTHSSRPYCDIRTKINILCKIV